MAATRPALVVLALLSAVPAVPSLAQTTRPAVATGTKVSVVDDRGTRTEGRVQEISDRSLRLAIGKAMTDIPLDQIVRIERPDTVRNGALTGLAIGLGLGLIATATDPEGGAIAVTRTLGNGLICAGLGALIDAAFDRRKTLYERGSSAQTTLAPVVGRHSGGLAVSIEW